MVDSQHVKKLEGMPQAGNPPGVALRLVRLPAIERIAPPLSRLGEVVGGHPRHDPGPAVLGQVEQVGPAPDVGAIVCDEDRQVTDDRDPEFGSPLPQPSPLIVEQELSCAGMVNSLGKLPSRGGEHAGLPAGNIRRPVGP